MSPRKLALAHLPTALFRHDALDRIVGTRVWVKRDDTTGGAEAGNKIRKLEYLLADALDRGATTVITCGGAQSNHARATALLAAQLGLKALLFLRTSAPDVPPATTANLLLDRLAGAETRFISPAQYAQRRDVMRGAAAELEARGERAYIIPEGGSNGLGALGYVDAMRETRAQLDLGLAGNTRLFDAVVHACGSGGTAAGVVLGAARWGVAPRVCAMAVCDDRAYFERVVTEICAEARSLEPALEAQADLHVLDGWRGPAYGVATLAQRQFIVEVARATGLVLDPVYTGKALYGLAQMSPKPPTALFIHTGGLPGLLAEAEAFDELP